ncbi:MAG TPA: hypothetical protein VMM35_10450, partial [Longimicrobiales bacterium]|nr:hypothetical protein [Longimicrobiales bacterium]
MRRLLLRLVHLFPEGFRKEFGAEMRDQIGEDHDRATSRGRGAALWFSATTGADVLASALREHLSPTWLGEPGSKHTHTMGRGRMTM